MGRIVLIVGLVVVPPVGRMRLAREPQLLLHRLLRRRVLLLLLRSRFILPAHLRDLAVGRDSGMGMSLPFLDERTVRPEADREEVTRKYRRWREAVDLCRQFE